eukprot:2983171-Rhodomonas_salina.2
MRTDETARRQVLDMEEVVHARVPARSRSERALLLPNRSRRKARGAVVLVYWGEGGRSRVATDSDEIGHTHLGRRYTIRACQHTIRALQCAIHSSLSARSGNVKGCPQASVPRVGADLKETWSGGWGGPRRSSVFALRGWKALDASLK